MVSRILNSLATRRKQLAEKEKGFTLIELLVVVIIIGILAAIAIPVYLGVQDNAKDSSAQSDVVNLKTAIVSMQTSTGGTLPAATAVLTNATTLTADASKAGASLSSNTVGLTYSPVAAPSNDFCVAAKSSSSGSTVFYSLATGGAVKVDATHALPATCTAP